MGAWGALIMSFFGAVFAALTLSWQWHVSGAALAAPFAVFAVIGLAAAHVIRLPGAGITLSERAARAIIWSSIAEGIGLFLVSNLVVNLGAAQLLLPAMALVVGLHFVPIAAAASFPPFYVLGAALVASAIAGAFVRAPAGGEIAGFVAAAALWTAATVAVRRDWHAKRSPASPR